MRTIRFAMKFALLGFVLTGFVGCAEDNEEEAKLDSIGVSSNDQGVPYKSEAEQRADRKDPYQGGTYPGAQ